MAVTATEQLTLKKALNQANPNIIADALAKTDLGSILESIEYDTGTVTAATAITLPDPGALVVQSVRVVAGTLTGARIVCDSGITPAQFGSTGIATCAVSANGKTITFEANVTQVLVRYVKNPAVLLTSAF